MNDSVLTLANCNYNNVSMMKLMRSLKQYSTGDVRVMCVRFTGNAHVSTVGKAIFVIMDDLGTFVQSFQHEISKCNLNFLSFLMPHMQSKLKATMLSRVRHRITRRRSDATMCE